MSSMATCFTRSVIASHSAAVSPSARLAHGPCLAWQNSSASLRLWLRRRWRMCCLLPEHTLRWAAGRKRYCL
jgi:hypothetical protein